MVLMIDEGIHLVISDCAAQVFRGNYFTFFSPSSSQAEAGTPAVGYIVHIKNLTEAYQPAPATVNGYNGIPS